MFFRRTRPAPAPAHDFPRIEYVPMSLAELEVYERVILGAEALVHYRRPDISRSGYKTEVIASLYQRVGAASLRTTDRTRVRIPLQKGEMFWLETALKDFDFYPHDTPELAYQGRQLLWRLNALLGRERAVIHAGGIPMFDPDNPAAVLVDDDDAFNGSIGRALPPTRT